MAEIQEHRLIWEKKSALRAIYADIFSRVREKLSDVGRTLEIGAGAGTARRLLPAEAWSADVFHTPWVNVVLDAHAIPFASGSLGNIVMVDTLHHVSSPLRFLDEVERVLRPGGRLVICDPYLSASSYVFYRWVHREGADPSWDLTPPSAALAKGAFANQAAESILFARRRRDRYGAGRSLALNFREPFGLAAYVMSGGFQRWSLLPAALADPLLALERRLPRLLRVPFGWRVLTVLEKQGA